jgi:uncharacterized protein (TIGR01777 family)
VAVLTRNTRTAALVLDPLIKRVEWDGMTAGDWLAEFDGVDAVINLAGASIANRRWTGPRKRQIWESRITATRLLVEAMRLNNKRPCTLLNASGIGYYGPSDDRLLDESALPGSGFLADLCVAWEKEARRAEDFGVRVVRMRLGMVLGEGGALPKLSLPFRFFVGGPIQPGSQWVSWIHLSDVIGLVQLVLKRSNIEGAVNAVSVTPDTMNRFCRTLGKVLHRPSWLSVPEWALRVALGELATVMTTGQRVAATVALQNGFNYRYPVLETALQSLVGPRVQRLPPARAGAF